MTSIDPIWTNDIDRNSIHEDVLKGGYRLTDYSTIWIVGTIRMIGRALGLGGLLVRNHDAVVLDLRNRALRLVRRGSMGLMHTTRTIRFEELVRIDVKESGVISEIRSALSHWDRGRIVLSLRGGKRLPILSGEMDELEGVLRRLRADAGIP